MTYNFNNVLEELEQGRTTEELAQAFANDLNAAVASLREKRNQRYQEDMKNFNKCMADAAAYYNTAVEYYFNSNPIPEEESMKDYYITQQMLIDTFNITGRVNETVRNIAKSLDPDDVVFLQDILHQFK